MTSPQNCVMIMAAIFLMFAPLYANAAKNKNTLPDGIINQLPKGYTEMAHGCGTIKEDNMFFCLVVGQSDDEEFHPDKDAGSPSRPLFIFTQNKDGSFTLSKKNDEVVMNMSQGGQCDPFDPEDGLVIKGNYFTVQNGVGCGNSHWTDYITFRYDLGLHAWVFHKNIYTEWLENTDNSPDAEAMKEGKPKIVSEKKGAPIYFEDYAEE